MTTTNATSKKITRTIARKFTSNFTRKKARAISRRKQLEMKAALERHSRKCIICHHPEREAIEEEFLHWRAPWKLAEDYNLADYRTIYRHARAAGLLLQRRENLHSGLDAFVEAVDDVKFTGDTILRAMRAYSCIDRHGRWTEIPTRVSISTFRDPGPAPSPAPYPENDSDVIDIEPEQMEEDLEEDEEEYDDPEDDPDDGDPDAPADEENEEEHSEPDDPEDDDPDDGPDNDAPADEENEEEHSEPASRSDATACAATSAQAFNVSNSDADFDGDPDDESDKNATESGEHNEDSKAEALPQGAPQHPPGRSATITTRAVSSKLASRSDATACAVPPAQALPRDAVRGQNLKDRSPSGRTDCAVSPAQPASTVSLNPHHRSRSETAPACADPPAQDSAHAAPQPRAAQHSNPASRSESTACAASPAQPAPHAHAWQNPLPPPAPLTDYPPVYPIYGPAIKNHHKTQCFSKLRFSNRR